MLKNGKKQKKRTFSACFLIFPFENELSS
jgi:hypothetical protein